MKKFLLCLLVAGFSAAANAYSQANPGWYILQKNAGVALMDEETAENSFSLHPGEPVFLLEDLTGVGYLCLDAYSRRVLVNGKTANFLTPAPAGVGVGIVQEEGLLTTEGETVPKGMAVWITATEGGNYNVMLNNKEEVSFKNEQIMPLTTINKMLGRKKALKALEKR